MIESEPNVVELFAYRISLFPADLEAFGDLQLVSRVPGVALSADRFFLVVDQLLEPPVAVPEPGSLAILIGSLSGLALLAPRRITATP